MSRNPLSDRRVMFFLTTILALGIGFALTGCSNDDTSATAPDFDEPLLYMTAMEAYDALLSTMIDSVYAYSDLTLAELKDRFIPYKIMIQQTDVMEESVNQGGNGLSVWYFSVADSVMKRTIDYHVKYRSYSGQVDGYGEVTFTASDTLSREQLDAIRPIKWTLDSDEILDRVLRGDVAYKFYPDKIPVHSSLDYVLHELGFYSQGYFNEPDTFYSPLDSLWDPIYDTLYTPTADGFVPVFAENWNPETDTLWAPFDSSEVDGDEITLYLNHKDPTEIKVVSSLNHLISNKFVNKNAPNATYYQDYLDISGSSWKYWIKGTDTSNIIFEATEEDSGFAKSFNEGGKYYWLISTRSGELFFNDEDTLYLPTSWISGPEKGSKITNDEGVEEWWCGTKSYNEGSFYFDNEVCPCDEVKLVPDYVMTWYNNGASSDTLTVFPTEIVAGNDVIKKWYIPEKELTDAKTLNIKQNDYGFTVKDDMLSLYSKDISLVHEFVVSGAPQWVQDEQSIDIAAVRSRMELQNFTTVTNGAGLDVVADTSLWVINSYILDSSDRQLYNGLILDFVYSE